MVVATLTAAGAVEDYDQHVRQQLASTLAAEANVDVDAVWVEVAPGSVLLTITIHAPSAQESRSIADRLATALPTAEDASRVLGIDVQTVAVSEVAPPGSPPPTPPALKPASPPITPLPPLPPLIAGTTLLVIGLFGAWVSCASLLLCLWGRALSRYVLRRIKGRPAPPAKHLAFAATAGELEPRARGWRSHHYAYDKAPPSPIRGPPIRTPIFRPPVVV